MGPEFDQCFHTFPGAEPGGTFVGHQVSIDLRKTAVMERRKANNIHTAPSHPYPLSKV